MGKQITPEGWYNWFKPEAEKKTFYAEYNCSGSGFQPEKRTIWSHQLTKSEAKEYTNDSILGINSKGVTDKWYEKFDRK
jgi:pectinesterase